MCKKKILAIMLSLSIFCTSITCQNVLAIDSINTETLNISIIYSDISEINKSENLGLSINIKGTVLNITDNIIIVEDNGCQASILTENFNVSGISVGDLIFAKGIVSKKQDSEDTVLLIQSSENLGLFTEDDSTSSDDATDNDNDNIVTDDSDKPTNENNSNNSNQNNNQGAPNQNNNHNQNQGGNSNNLNNNGNNGSINNPSSNSSNSFNSQSNTSNTVSISKIKAKTITTISNDLSENQWSKVKSALEDGLIKLVDLPNNKIKIVQILEDSGDKVWIVNDPEKKDMEITDDESEEVIFKVGYELIKSLEYTNFDITETKWNTILSKVEKGNAKAKLNNEGNLIIRYIVDGGKDTTSIISKID